MNNLGDFGTFLAALNGILWHEYVMFGIVATGILFTVWSGFSQYRALTHGPRVVRGIYDDPSPNERCSCKQRRISFDRCALSCPTCRA